MSGRKYYITCGSIIMVALVTAWSCFRGGDRPPLTLDEQEKNFGDLSPAQVVKVGFRFQNNSSQPLRLVGASMTCKPWGCLYTDADFPVNILPGKDVILETSFKTGDSPGNFSHSMTVYSNCDQSPQIVLNVTGQVVVPHGSDDL